MLKFFSVTNPVALLLIFIYDVVFRMSLFIKPYDYTELSESKEPLTRLFYHIVRSVEIDSGIILGILAILIVYAQALLLNQIIAKHKLFEKVGLLPALVYIIVTSLIPSFLVCSGALLSMTFIILIIDKLFETFKHEKYDGLIFDCGFLAGIAALFYFPNFLLVFFIIAGNLTLHTFSFRDQAIIIVGFLNPFFLIFTYHFWTDQPAYIWSELLRPSLVNKSLSFDLNFSNIGGLGILFLMAGVILFNIQMFSRGSLIQLRKFMGIVLILSITVLLSVFLMRDIQVYHFVLLAIPISIGFFQILVNFKKVVIGEISHILLILSVLILQYLPYFYTF